MPKAKSTRRVVARGRNTTKSTPPMQISQELRPILERIYSTVAVCLCTLDSDHGDRDIDVARVLRHSVIQPLADLCWPLDAEGGAE